MAVVVARTAMTVLATGFSPVMVGKVAAHGGTELLGNRAAGGRPVDLGGTWR